MGFGARAHIAGNTLLDLERLAVLAGPGRARRRRRIANPYLGKAFSLAAVSTDYALATDLPLRADALRGHGPAATGGASTARNRAASAIAGRGAPPI